MSSLAVDVLADWVRDPRVFVREEFGATPDAWQDDVLEAAGSGVDRIALVACKGPGKSTVDAWIIWWWLVTRPHAKVVATSISAPNLKDDLWTELAKWQGKGKLTKRYFSWQAERVVQKQEPETWFASARTWSRDADSTRLGETLAGVHGDHVLFVIDEAGGVPRAVVATAEAGLANAGQEGRTALLLLSGNPTTTEGPLYDAAERDRASWRVFHVTADPDDPKRSPRVSREWAQGQIDKYGRNNPWVKVNVFGQFPAGSSNCLLGLEEVLAATKVQLSEAEYRDHPLILGVDVARFGDDRSVIAARQGRAVFRLDNEFRNTDTMTLAGHVARVIERARPEAIFVDQGGVGGGVVDRLRQLGHFKTIGVDFGGKPTNQVRYHDKRSEMWGEMADWIKTGGGGIPNDPELISELSAPTYSFAPDGGIKLESKDSMKKRGRPSPDKGDAVALTFAFPVHLRAPGEPRGEMVHDFDPYEERR